MKVVAEKARISDNGSLVKVQFPSPALKTNHRLLEIIVFWSLALSG